MLDELYDMAIGERRREDIIDMSIVRVPGGWIFIDYNDSSSQSQCFVPYVDKEAAQDKGSVQNSTGEYTPTNKASGEICPGCGGTGKVTKPYLTSTNCIQCGGSGKLHHS